MNDERHSGSLECVGFLGSRNTQPLVVWDVLFLTLHLQNCPGERKEIKGHLTMFSTSSVSAVSYDPNNNDVLFNNNYYNIDRTLCML